MTQPLEKAIDFVFEIAEDLKNREFDDFPEAIKVASNIARELRLEGYYTPLVKTSSKIKFKGNPKSVGNFADYLGRLLGLWQGNILGIPNKPGPLGSLMVLAPLGAALGYGGANLANLLTGGNAFTHPVNAAIMGGLAGSAPAGLLAAYNYAAKHPMTDSALNFSMTKESSFSYIPVDKFKEVVYGDPNVASSLSRRTQAAAVGLVESANHLPGRRYNDFPIVTPNDIARVAVGMGSGYASGLLVGKALGGLFGVSDNAQQILRRSGAAAGIIRSMVPLVYNGGF
jgi:hypothetical protein